MKRAGCTATTTGGKGRRSRVPILRRHGTPRLQLLGDDAVDKFEEPLPCFLRYRRARRDGVAPAAPAEAEKERPSDEPYIETPRCSSCDECIQINNKMFAYDANKQARIVDANAGTYRQLVEAAESCQVAVIHPGKPKNPNEAGLDDLLKRAESFL